jgi:predicted nucleic acid-binding protein
MYDNNLEVVPSRIAYLFDASAIVPFYRHNPELEPKVNHLVNQHEMGRATLFMPNFCIAEVFNTFAKLNFRSQEIKKEEYDQMKNKFRSDIRRGRMFYEYPLHIYHIYNVDFISPFEHQLFIGKNKNEFLSTLDILIIGMGIELVNLYGNDNFRIITCDKRLAKICENLRKFDKEVKVKYNIPENIVYPQAIDLYSVDINQLPVVKGQVK